MVLLFREYRRPDPDLMNSLTKVAYRLQIRANNEPLSKFTSHDVPTPYLRIAHMPKLYRPRLHDSSHVVEDNQWEILWRWVPSSARILDPMLKFTSFKHGHSIKAIHRVLWDEDDKPMVFFLKTIRGDIIGGICPFPFKVDSRCMSADSDLSSASVFQLHPNQLNYQYSGAASTIMSVTQNHIIFGSNAPAIMIDKDLLNGHTAPSETFNSPKLVSSEDGDFQILALEIWLLC
eukprot:Blabericola_migrator_1__5273@NODE_2708_length_2438_cov_58_282581_g1673_i1_p2_GENE_NODE_2708_length_2438_cov_58_282581_g1673_i1NODE_2708_length_2438_cov_58_282581_g1673_i1_p2_ORF_typecomplete_len233_score20_05TLD/PF07534_16/3_9e20_NODE_2708_length_2438_cov_58_282581_g1673_i115462244